MPAPPCGDYGDVNGDGNVNTLDVTMVQDHIIDPIAHPFTDEQKRRADVNGDGKVNTLDVTLISDYVAEIITTFPVCGVTPPSDCPWDLNGDGVVDDVDKQWLTDHSGTCIPGSKGDFNGDGVIDIDDIIIMGQHYGPCPVVTPPPNMETRTMSLEIGKSYQIQVSLLPDYETLTATINVSSTGVTCTAGPCNTTGPPGVTTSGWTVTTYLKAGTVTSDVCSWINSIGGWRNLQWTSHVLEAYYTYIGAAGHSVGFSPVTWNDVLGLYYYYINDPTAGNGKIGCGT